MIIFQKIKLISLILYLIAPNRKASCELKINNFCILDEKAYKNSVCKNYQCISDICSVHKADCDEFKDWTLLLDRYRNYDFIGKRIKIY